ncbi:hypothetical protein NMY22_g11052 [Coprinellus aureogranulatus]|nr:hypothetical protein NMY22_g11052 [Coprinellus aureogranulatus]
MSAFSFPVDSRELESEELHTAEVHIPLSQRSFWTARPLPLLVIGEMGGINSNVLLGFEMTRKMVSTCSADVAAIWTCRGSEAERSSSPCWRCWAFGKDEPPDWQASPSDSKPRDVERGGLSSEGRPLDALSRSDNSLVLEGDCWLVIKLSPWTREGVDAPCVTMLIEGRVGGPNSETTAVVILREDENLPAVYGWWVEQVVERGLTGSYTAENPLERSRSLAQSVAGSKPNSLRGVLHRAKPESRRFASTFIAVVGTSAKANRLP